MFRISRWAAGAAFGGVLALLATLAGPSAARADVTEVFNLFGEFDNDSTLSGTVTIDTTIGTATAIYAFANGFEFKNIATQAPQGMEYLVEAESAGDAAQLSLVFGVGSLVGYGGSSLSRDTRIGSTIFLTAGGADPAESSPIPEPSSWALMIVGLPALASWRFAALEKRLPPQRHRVD